MSRLTRLIGATLLSSVAIVGGSVTANAAEWRHIGIYPSVAECEQAWVDMHPDNGAAGPHECVVLGADAVELRAWH